MGDTYEFRAQLGTMYQAARVEFPHYAQLVSDCCNQLSSSLSVYQFQLGPMQHTPPLVDAVAMNTECYNLLRRAVIFLNNGAAALDAAAHNFEKTDEAAAKSSKDIQGLLEKPLPTVAVPSPLPTGGN